VTSRALGLHRPAIRESLFVGLPHRSSDGWLSTRRRSHVGRSPYSATHQARSDHIFSHAIMSLPKKLLSCPIPTWGCSGLIHPEVFALEVSAYTLPSVGKGGWCLRPSSAADSYSPTDPFRLAGQKAFQPAQLGYQARAPIAGLVAVPGGGLRKSRPCGP
jgi:hypothetical protein